MMNFAAPDKCGRGSEVLNNSAWGHGQTEERPGRNRYIAPGQRLRAGPPRRSGQLSAVCQEGTRAAQREPALEGFGTVPSRPGASRGERAFHIIALTLSERRVYVVHD